jgi:pimeloyl-ACP methyl ester carboxylesterase
MTANEGILARLARNGIGIHHEAPGQGPPIMLTHGFGATRRMWDEQIEEFTDRFQLIAWDLPGHGDSGVPTGKETVSPESVIEDMVAILDANEVRRPVLVGLGIGGVLSLRFVHAYPDRVRGLVLIGTMPGLRSGVARDIWNAQVRTLAESLERDGLNALEGGAEVDPRLHADAGALATAARGLLMQNDDGALAGLAAIDVPVLILVGSEDRPNLTAAAYLARMIPHARKIVIARANHAANIHKPAAVNTAIRDFLGRISK